MKKLRETFDLSGRVAVITGGAGLLGVKHAEAIAEFGGIPILADIDLRAAEAAARGIAETYGGVSRACETDITNAASVDQLRQKTVADFGRLDILINNAAYNPKVERAPESSAGAWSRFENFPIDQWNRDLAVSLTGAFLCSQLLGPEMVRRGGGVILNIASDLGVIAPDQRIYRQDHLTEGEQPAKPVSYSVVKHGLIGLTRYLATYWAADGIRVNALSPGGVENNQDPNFVRKLTQLIPLGRMARPDEYKAAVVFLVSDASAYMTGANLMMEGGRTVW